MCETHRPLPQKAVRHERTTAPILEGDDLADLGVIEHDQPEQKQGVKALPAEAFEEAPALSAQEQEIRDKLAAYLQQDTGMPRKGPASLGQIRKLREDTVADLAGMLEIQPMGSLAQQRDQVRNAVRALFSPERHQDIEDALSQLGKKVRAKKKKRR